MKFISACQNHQEGESAEKCLSQRTQQKTLVGFEARPFDHNHGALTTRPRYRQLLRLQLLKSLLSLFNLFSSVSESEVKI